MAIDALQLRPRSPVALFDAALGLCASSSGLWALTLPAGAALVAAVFHLAEAATFGRPLAGPVALLTAAWALRAIAQGAACHHIERQLLDVAEPRLWPSVRAALARAPSLVVTATVVAVVNVSLAVFTAGVGFLFFGAQAAAYAATMRGEGSALGILGTTSRLLGPARHTAPWVRMCGLTQLLLALNLQLFVSLLLYLGQSVLGFEVGFAQRFTAPDNGLWLTTVATVTFALFEPVRAATATLLLIDGRVRLEGLDLTTAVAGLPRRRPTRGVTLGVTALLLMLLWPGTATASALRDRASDLLETCDEPGPLDLDVLDDVPGGQEATLSRFVSRFEQRVYDDDDCTGVYDGLREGLRLVREDTRLTPADARSAREAARAILARPEFRPVASPDAPEVEEAQGPSGFSKWWDEFWARLWRWLQKRDSTPREAPTPVAPGGEMLGANVVMLVVTGLLVGTLLFLLLRGLGRKRAQEATPDVEGAAAEEALVDDPMSALARPPEGWASLADQLAAQGQFRDAIRHLYLALLSRLHRAGAIDYDSTLSNWEYLAAFKGPGEWKPPFRELTLRFDFVWYGNRDATQSSYAAFRQTVGPLLVVGAGEPSRG